MAQVMESVTAKQSIAAERDLPVPVASSDGASSTALNPVLPRDKAIVVPLSAEQHRVWFHAMTQPELPFYNESLTIHRRGALNLEALEASLNEILSRHEAWRTSFVLLESELVQVIHSSLKVTLPVTDLSQLPEEEREREARRLATADADAVIPTDKAPLFRARVVRMAPDYHRLYLTLHHIIFDGTSISQIFLPELAAIYQAKVSGEPSLLALPRLQYADYAIWQRQYVASSAVAPHLDYWRQKLSGELPVLLLPLDRPRPVQLTHRGARECFQLSPALTSALRALSQSMDVSLYVILIAAFKTLLFRYSGQEDLILGGATDARTRPDLTHVMGNFLDTFAVRTYPCAEKPFSAYLREVSSAVHEAVEAADVPFSQVVQAVQPRRDSSHHPIFQVFFSLEAEVGPFSEGWDLSLTDVEVKSSKFDLYLEIEERPDHMAARFMYNSEIFDPETIQRMVGHWRVMLEAVCKDPERGLGTLPILTQRERLQLDGPGGWNDTWREFPDTPLHALLEAQALRTPNAIAARFEGVDWTYAELMARAALLADILRQAGATQEKIVAVYLGRSLDLLAGLIAVLMSGAAYLPLDPKTPQARIAICLEDADPVAILSQSSLAGELPKTATQLILVDKPALISGRERLAEPRQSRPSDIAYVIHTSGTTGRPKAVEISHASAVNLLVSMQAEPGFTSTDTMLAVTTVSFDIAGLELFLPLLSGGKVVIAGSPVAQDPYLLAACIQSSGCTVMQATPSTWRALLSIGWRVSKPPLRGLCGGEPMPRELAERLLEAGVELWNVYGPTETTVWSTAYRVDSTVGPVSIGRPIANTSAYILDARRQLLPAGVPGHLYLGGVGLARGYRGMPAMTAEKFVEVEAVGGARLYCTGDLAVLRADGKIYCMGRTDNQVKVRGFRIELEGVEAAVLQHPQVAACAARVWPDAAGGTRLSVYLVGKNGAPPDPSSLRHFLQADLPDYMIPSDVVPVEAIPLTSNGKINRAALPQPPTRAGLRSKGEASTPYELRLATIWADLLGMKTVGVDEDFFDLGGHSLLVAMLQQRIATAFGHRLSMASIFHAPTVQQQALLLQAAADKVTTGPGLINLQPRGEKPAFFWMHPPPEIRNLVSALGEERPFLGLALTQADIDAMQDEPDIQRIAQLHVKTILMAQPQGPYHLGGFCNAGIVAYETAVQMRALGHEVGLLVLLDAQNPVFFRRLDSLKVEWSRIRFHLKQARRRGAEKLGERLMFRARKLWRPEETGTTEMSAAERITDLSTFQYRPADYSGNVLLVRPIDRPTEVDYLPTWVPAVSGRLMAADVCGSHEDLFTPGNVSGLAEVIFSHLGEIESAI